MQENPKEDSELGYSDFTLVLTFHLPHPQQKDMQLFPMHKKFKYENGRWSKAGAQSTNDQQAGGSDSPEPTTSVI